MGAFCHTAKYKGGTVRIRELQFERKKDISREVMKEMKLMRELRHDNVNSFIGACVDMSPDQHMITLITEYCAKGALNDILENMDIKLEPLFIHSMIHDLIKGMLFLHNSDMVTHGNLRSSNCVVTSRWTLQVTAHYRLHTALYTSHCTLQTAHCIAHFTLHTSHCTLHTAHCTLHTAQLILHARQCTLLQTPAHSCMFTLHTWVPSSIDDYAALPYSIQCKLHWSQYRNMACR